MSYKIIPIPEDEDKRAKRLVRLKRNTAAAGIITVTVGIAAVIFLIATVVMLVVAEIKDDADNVRRLLYILIGACGGGSVVCALVAVFLSRLSDKCYKTESDYRERLDGDDTFFAGDGTFCTFEENALVLHAEDGKGERVFVPYSAMRFFSVCTRRAPREKGVWSVVMEIPVKFIGRKGKFKPNDPPALVQTDAKERLYECLKKHGLELIGELPENGKKGKFRALKKFAFPDRRARKRALLLMAVGGVLTVGGIPAAILWNVAAGSMLCVLGAFLLGRATLSFTSAKSILGFYEEGVFWKEKNRTECMFLKWNELSSVSFSEKDGFPYLKAETAYGSYHFPSTPDAEAYCRENFSDRVAIS